jgi:5-methylcytosine-specific restriction endonuclease McrA
MTNLTKELTDVAVTGIAAKILAVLQDHPEGMDIKEIAEIVTPDAFQQQFDRRLRELDPHYVIARHRIGKRTVYRLVGPRAAGGWDYEVIGKTLRAQALKNGRCAMCGQTVAEDGVKLQVDHRIPREWGGKTEADNLIGLCSACNEGKRNYFSTFNAATMKECINHESPHWRIALLLKSKMLEWVDTDYIEFAANFNDFQDDWQKRLRELRDLGLIIKNQKIKRGRRTVSQYMLTNWKDLPPEEQVRRTIGAQEKTRKKA